MTGNTGIVSATFVVYIGVMLALGYIAYKRTTNLSDYILGGRSLGPGTAALSAGASDMSGWLLLGLPGYALAAGYEASWIAIGLLAGTWLNWLIVARRLRVYSHAVNDSLTLPAYFEFRFEDNTRLLRVIAAVFILLFFLFYTSSGLVAAGKLFESTFGFGYEIAVIVGTLAIISYTFFGGFLAVSWTDVIQGLLMAAALVIVPIMALNTMGGWEVAHAAMEAKNPNLLTFFTDVDGNALGFVAIISLLGWGLGYFGQPHVLARFKAVQSDAALPTARRIAVLWTAVCLLAALFIGWIGIGYFGDAGLGDAETVFLALVQALMHPLVAGILLAAVLAAIMSTADSQLLVSSSALAEDFYKALFRRDATQTELVWVGRFAVVGIALLALIFAFNPESTVLGLVSYAWAGFGAAFGPAIILSLFWKRMNRNGALAGIIVGGLTVVIYKQIDTIGLYEIIPGFILATIAIVVVTLLTPAPSKTIEATFDDVSSRF
ncbi:sodium/proline symporter PutP [Halopseudomonas phragmitis]|uniref:Sodium/proline symporter n=2 Tax=Pseudomonadaceae TaxID=135621 RepID=A0A1V0B7Z0_9GAMM|nr:MULTISPECIES: sodium/proline symporter PutP [Pseudomonadaceae]AQZ95904.1 sodium/proline symporter [Halopseudomonas phragmitis]PAU88845.1 sodium/proline symporter PutP [Pseudomonas sp. WN033]RHW21090.1 sodium/proline symporter PutP [Pseudomonas jilinensis]